MAATTIDADGDVGTTNLPSVVLVGTKGLQSVDDSEIDTADSDTSTHEEKCGSGSAASAGSLSLSGSLVACATQCDQYEVLSPSRQSERLTPASGSPFFVRRMAASLGRRHQRSVTSDGTRSSSVRDRT